MNIKIHSSELNRMMKTIVQCIDPKDQNKGNIEIICDNNLLSIRGSNSQVSAFMSTPLLGSETESFYVDGTMFARVCAMCNGEINISTDGKTCTVKGAGRTRLPMVDAKIPVAEEVKGKKCIVLAEDFSRGYASVAHAIGSDQSRLVLTGVLLESTDNGIKMVTLDGFKMAVECVDCKSDGINIIVPALFMKLVSSSTCAGETITLCTDGKRIQATTDGMVLSCGLLTGEFPDYNRVTPTQFKTESIVHADAIQNALKCGSVVNTSNNLVKLNVSENSITVMSNSEQADFDAEVSCETQGDALKIAFNHKFLMESIASIVGNEIIMKFGSPVSPCVIQGKDSNGYRLLLPVRVVG